MRLTCSHVLAWVGDLHQAVADYRKLGFEVTYATEPEKARHAHIWFARGPIIELLTTPSSARLFRWPIELAFGRGSGRRMTGWPDRGEGLCDVALVTPDQDLRGVLTELRKAGVPAGRAVRWRRTPPGGPTTTFRYAYPRNPALPFLVTPYDPPLRPDLPAHPNGATALTAVRMGVRPGDERALRLLTEGDPALRIEAAERTGPLSLEIAGLDAAPDPRLTHGVELRPAARA